MECLYGARVFQSDAISYWRRVLERRTVFYTLRLIGFRDILLLLLVGLDAFGSWRLLGLSEDLAAFERGDLLPYGFEIFFCQVLNYIDW